MIEISFCAGMCLVLCAWLLLRTGVYLKTKLIDWNYEFRQLFFLINLLVIVRFTFYPFSTVNGQVQPLIFEPDAVFPFRINWVPFVNLMDYESKSDLLVNIIGNFALFIPTGIMLPLIYHDLNTLKKVMLTGFAISLSIEILQLPFAVRASDIDDLILNTAGCLTGFSILSLVHRCKHIS